MRTRGRPNCGQCRDASRKPQVQIQEDNQPIAWRGEARPLLPVNAALTKSSDAGRNVDRIRLEIGGNMRSRLSFALLLTAFAVLGSPVLARAPLSDTQVRQAIIKESIAGYSGSCPCPYNKAKNASNCGGRSAYSRGGGAAPLCYSKDVTDEMVADWKRQHP